LEKKFILHPGSAAVNFLQDVIQDCYKRLLFPSIENEIRRALMKRAEDESFQVFGDNLESLLMAPPAGRRPVMGIDPGFRTGCKIAVLDHTGKFLEHQTIFPHAPRNQSQEAGDIIIRLLKPYKIELIAAGNGTAGRETEAFIRGILNAVSAPAEPVVVMVSEAGASVYSASPAAAAEFPDFDLTVRGAISIGRRL